MVERRAVRFEANQPEIVRLASKLGFMVTDSVAVQHYLQPGFHGHHHNNDLAKFPLIHRENRTVNVSAELLNYTPISLDELAAKVKAAK